MKVAITATLSALHCVTTQTHAFIPASCHSSQKHRNKSSITIEKISCFVSSQSIDDFEFHHSDPASTTPELLSSLWSQIADGCNNLSKGESTTVFYPNMEGKLTSDYLERIMGHFDVCKDVCDDFGLNTILLPFMKENNGHESVAGFTVKSYKDEGKIGAFKIDGELAFNHDPMFDDEDWDIIDKKIQAAVEDAENEEDEEDDLPMIENRIPIDDDEIYRITKTWVSKMMSDMGICPFTNGADLAGLPMGKVFYTIDRLTKVEDMYARYWKEVVRVERNPEKELSTTLLITPSFLIDNNEMFENFSNSLTQPLESLNVEDLLQLVFFHPEWTFRDGGERSGTGAAANYARRSPWPMINILRTTQVRTAQRGIPTGLVYQQNEKTLSSIGANSLEKMLRLRDWSDIADLKVDRKDMEALRVAHDLQTTGVIASEDKSVVFDSTPAANKVDVQQIEGGNIINVVLQALEKRISGGGDGTKTQLSGAETSAAMMASDFLMDHFEKLGNKKFEKRDVHPFAERYFDIDDDFDQNEVSENDEASVLFGGAGIMTESEPYGE